MELILRIGVDLDNTIICYDEAFVKIARQENLISPEFEYNSKTEVRDFIRELLNGEYEWQRLQGLVYGKLIMQAKLFNGVAEFFAQSAEKNIDLYIVSHKTELAHHDPEKTNLRVSALKFLENHGFFDKLSMKRENVFFESTREEKINRIKNIGCKIFIDDLPEVLLDKSFPSNCQKIFFSQIPEDGLKNTSSWQQIKEQIFYE